jgi:hypothetical protein
MRTVLFIASEIKQYQQLNHSEENVRLVKAVRSLFFQLEVLFWHL